MQPIPTPPDPGPWTFLLDLVDARWIVTTIVALYAAVLTTFQTFVKDWWLHRPRIKVKLSEMMVLSVGGDQEEVLMVAIINNGYQPRKIGWTLSYAVKEIHVQKTLKDRYYYVSQPNADPALPAMVAPSDSVKMWSPKRNLQTAVAADGLRENRLHAQALVYDGAGKTFKSNWLEVNYK